MARMDEEMRVFDQAADEVVNSGHGPAGAGWEQAVAVLGRLASHRVRRLCKGQYLFHPGDPVTGIHVLRKGRISFVRISEDGNPLVLHVATAGDWLAEASLFSPVYHCSAVVDSATAELSCFDRRELLDACRASPDLAMRLMALLARHVRHLRAIMEIRNIRSARQRVEAWLELASNDRGEAHLDLSLKDIAHQLGLAHETLYRVLKQLEQDGRIVRKPGRIQLRRRAG